MLRKLGRREFLVAGGSAAAAGAGGLVLGYWGGARQERYRKRVPPREQPLSPSVFLAIDTTGAVTVWVTKSEMGQGVRTALPMIVAEELEADWSRVRIEQAVASLTYGDQVTAASKSVRSLWNELRKAGAAAREMLISAAADVWGEDRRQCRAELGAVVHRPTGRRLPFGVLVERAGELEVPQDPPLKRPRDFSIVGTRRPRLDVPEKVDGRAVFGLDVRRPGMVFAAVARCPEMGGSLGSFEAASARAVPGVLDVFEIPTGVAVIGETTWAALSGRSALQVEWRSGPHGDFSSAGLRAALRNRASEKGAVAREEGDALSLLEATSTLVEATYEVPYLAHAPMEPPNCTAQVQDDRCELWAPTQDPMGCRLDAARALGLDEGAVTVRTTLLGGGFGRRAHRQEIEEVVAVAKRTARPTQIVWSREDDVRHDYFRPPALHRMRAAVREDGTISAWHDRVVTPSMTGSDSADGSVDGMAVQGAADLPYAIPNLRVEWVHVDQPVRLGIWRSVAHSFNAFAVECFLDELADAVGADPAEFRRRLLEESPRLKRVLEVAVEGAGWGSQLADGRGRGVAAHSCFGSHAAQVVEASLEEGRVRVHRVVCAVDCGMVVNPDVVEAQVEGGIAFGLTAALHGEITFDRGRVQQSNFHDYRMLRLPEMPAVEVHIVKSGEAPGGVGELAVPPVAPALANALHAATGRRIRRLPIRLDEAAVAGDGAPG